MSRIDSKSILAGYGTEGGLAVWKKVVEPQNDELYAFVEDLMFSSAAKNTDELPRLIEEYQRTLESIGQAAIISLDKLMISDNITVYLNDEDNFVTQAMPHIAGVMKGDKRYQQYMSSGKENTLCLVSVRIEGVVIGEKAGASVFFNTKVLAIEANKKTGLFTIVEVIGDDSETNPLDSVVTPTAGGTISTTLGDLPLDTPPLDASISFLSTEPVPGEITKD